MVVTLLFNSTTNGGVWPPYFKELRIMNRIEKINKRDKLSFAEYSECYAGKKKQGKQKRGKTRYFEQVED